MDLAGNLAGFRAFRPSRRTCRSKLIPAGAGALVALCLSISAASAAPDSPAGLWFTQNEGSIIKIAPCGENFCGTLIWLKEPDGLDGKPKSDTLNEDSSKRGKPLIGLEILKNLSADNDRWRGTAYNPENGKTYDITFKVVPDEAAGDKAEIEGCVLKILCKTDVFTKTQAVPKGPSPSP
jgi:uncharacterized protein (DUF2147 family)